MLRLIKTQQLLRDFRACRRLPSKWVNLWAAQWSQRKIRLNVPATLVKNWFCLQQLFYQTSPLRGKALSLALLQIEQDCREFLRNGGSHSHYREAAWLQLSWTAHEQALLWRNHVTPDRARGHWANALRRGEKLITLMAERAPIQLFNDQMSCANELVGFLIEQGMEELAREKAALIKIISQKWYNLYPAAQASVLAGCADMELLFFSSSPQPDRGKFEQILQQYQQALEKSSCPALRGQICWHRGLSYYQLSLIEKNMPEKSLWLEQALGDWDSALQLVDNTRLSTLIQWARVQVLDQLTPLLDQAPTDTSPLLLSYAKLFNQRRGRKQKKFTLSDSRREHSS